MTVVPVVPLVSLVSVTVSVVTVVPAVPLVSVSVAVSVRCFGDSSAYSASSVHGVFSCICEVLW